MSCAKGAAVPTEVLPRPFVFGPRQPGISMARNLIVEVSQQFAETDGRFWQLAIPAGQWRHPRYGVEDNSPDRLQRYVDNLHGGVKLQGDQPNRLPVTIDHNDGLGAGGWIYDARVAPRGVELLWEPTEQGRQAVESGEYPFFSVDTEPIWPDPATGKRYRDVIAGGSLVVRPFWKQLEVHTHSEDPQPDVLWADTEDRMTDEERAAQAAAQDEGAATPEPGAAVSVAATQQHADVGSRRAVTQADAEPGEAETVDAKQFQELREQLAELRLKDRTRHFADELGGHQYSEGRLAPGPRQRLAELLAALPDDLGHQFAEALKAVRFYQPGEAGLDTPDKPTKQFSDEDRLVMAQVGLAEADDEEVAR